MGGVTEHQEDRQVTFVDTSCRTPAMEGHREEIVSRHLRRCRNCRQGCMAGTMSFTANRASLALQRKGIRKTLTSFSIPSSYYWQISNRNQRERGCWCR